MSWDWLSFTIGAVVGVLFAVAIAIAQDRRAR
jgi:hypothetical protein